MQQPATKSRRIFLKYGCTNGEGVLRFGKRIEQTKCTQLEAPPLLLCPPYLSADQHRSFVYSLYWSYFSMFFKAVFYKIFTTFMIMTRLGQGIVWTIETPNKFYGKILYSFLLHPYIVHVDMLLNYIYIAILVSENDKANSIHLFI